LDNQLVTFMSSKAHGTNPFLQEQIQSLRKLSAADSVEFLLSEEVLAEICQLPEAPGFGADVLQTQAIRHYPELVSGLR
jgi:hypothetical protein